MRGYAHLPPTILDSKPAKPLPLIRQSHSAFRSLYTGLFLIRQGGFADFC